MNESREELAAQYVLDQLEPAARAAFEEQLVGDADLAAHVRELETALAEGVRALPQREPPAALLARIEAQIGEEQNEERNLPAGQVGRSKSAPLRRIDRTSDNVIQGPWLAWAKWGIAAVIAVSLATLAVQSLRGPAQPVFLVVGLDGATSSFAELSMKGVSPDPDARFIRLATLAQGYWTDPGDLPVKSVPGSDNHRGYAVFDPASRQGFIAIEHLPAIAENQRYHLWVADASTGRVRDAGILPLAGINRGLFSFTTAPADGSAARHPNFFVTVEEASAAPAPEGQPRGEVVLGKESI